MGVGDMAIGNEIFVEIRLARVNIGRKCLFGRGSHALRMWRSFTNITL